MKGVGNTGREPRLDFMAVIECSACFKRFEDDVLCCPHCGTAQIPQLTLAEKRLELMRESKGALPAIYAGLVLGLLLGTALFVVTLINGTASLGSGLAILSGGMSGSAVGFFVHYLFLSRRKR